MSAKAAESMMAPPLTATISPAAFASRAKSPRPSIGLVRFSTFGLNQLLMKNHHQRSPERADDLDQLALSVFNDSRAARCVACHGVRSHTPRFSLRTPDPTGIPGQDGARSDEDEGRRQGQAVQPLRPVRVTDKPGE